LGLQFFGVYVSAFVASFLLQEKNCHSDVQWGKKKVFYQNNPHISFFSSFDFGAVIFFTYIKGHVAQLLPQ
jgi:hypothetical protein